MHVCEYQYVYLFISPRSRTHQAQLYVCLDCFASKWQALRSPPQQDYRSLE